MKFLRIFVRRKEIELWSSLTILTTVGALKKVAYKSMLDFRAWSEVVTSSVTRCSS